MGLGGVDVEEGLFNPKTVGTDQRLTMQQSQIGAELGQNAAAAQNAAFGSYMDTLQGLGPSLAEIQMQQQAQRDQQAALAMAGAARGGNPAGQYQQALSASSGMAAQNNAAGAQLRAMEQAQAADRLAALGGQMAGQQFGYEQLGANVNLGLRGQDLDYNLGKRGLDLQGQDQRFKQNMEIAQAGARGVGSILQGIIASDVRLKDNVAPASVADAAAEIGGARYRYEPGAGPGGEQLGVVADQVAETSLGPTLVQRGPDGYLQIDGGRAGVAGLAASGENTRRIRALEQQLAINSGQGTDAQRYGTLEEGQQRQREAQQLTNEMAAIRGRALVERETPRGYDFSSSPQMMRSVDPYAVDPFAGDAALDAYLAAEPPPELGRPIGDRITVGENRRAPVRQIQPLYADASMGPRARVNFRNAGGLG